ncbi:MAG TPA: exodeoxyribonuclease III [Candidatus Binatia bacterium]|nr:exodeoxyribonuclease III [Candidatus Binatia bacterium]
MRLATWNVNSITARLPRLLAWLGEAQPDVVCLQETKVADALFPRQEITGLGYQVASHGLGRWNGVAILSRAGLADVAAGLPGEPGAPDPEARAVAATCGGVRVWSVYVPNGRALDSPQYEYKLAWLAALRNAIAAELATGARRLVSCGDFNIAPTDDDVWDPAVFAGATHVSPPERAAFGELLDLGLSDLRPRALKGRPFTYWDYRAGMFHKGEGMRIDLVLLSEALAGRVADAYVDREARKGSLPSDHAPVVVDLDLDGC